MALDEDELASERAIVKLGPPASELAEPAPDEVVEVPYPEFSSEPSAPDPEVLASERTVPDPSVLEDVASGKIELETSTSTIPAPVLDGGKATRGRGLDLGALVALLAFVLVGGLLVFGFARALVPAAEAQLGAACRPLQPLEKSGAIPALELEDLAGNAVSLADFRGKFLVVNFWATWCEPCTREWPDLDVLGARMAEREDVAVIAISVDQDPELIGPYLGRMGLSETAVTILRAKDPAAHQAFGSQKIPDTYFVSREGEFEAVFVNVREWGKAKAFRCVEASSERL